MDGSIYPFKESSWKALAIQEYFSGMAGSKLSHESIDKIRDVLSSILGSAKKYGLLVTNPVEGIELPPTEAEI